MPKIRKVVEVKVVVELDDTDDWAAEYNADPHDIDHIQCDVGEWLTNAVYVSLTEMPGNANTLRITDVDTRIVSSEVEGVRPEDSWTPPPTPVEPTGRRIRVAWQTEEVREYDEVVAVPDEVADEDIPNWIDDGDNPTLIETEGHAAYVLSSFLRDTTSWKHVTN